jgi:iron(III) transport system substrate-binding protein
VTLGRVARGAVGLLVATLAAWWLLSPGKQPTGNAGDLSLADDPDLVRAARREGKLVWYTSLPTDAAVEYLEAFRRRYPFLDTSEFYRSTSYRIYSRLEVETAADKYIADVVELGLVPAVAGWKRRGWLLRHDSPAYEHYPPEMSEPGYWAPMRLFPIVAAYNPRTLDASEAPRRWWDLADPKWKGAIGVEGSDSGTQHLQYYLIKEKLGERFWGKFAANRPRAYGGSGAVLNALLSGEIKVALCALSYAIVRHRQLAAAPITAIWPEEGVPVSMAPLAILAGAPHPNAARLFVDWVLSAEGQGEMTRLVGAYSARADVPAPPGQPAKGEFTPLLVTDWDAFAATTGDFQRTWRELTR